MPLKYKNINVAKKFHQNELSLTDLQYFPKEPESGFLLASDFQATICYWQSVLKYLNFWMRSTRYQI